MIIVLLGAPGAGKGTQSVLVAEKYGLKHISTGDLLREEIANNTELGKQAKKLIDGGNLVPDEMILGLLKNAFLNRGKGVVLDGFPRTLSQAEMMHPIVKGLAEKLSAVINIKLSEDEITQRIVLRRQCKNCGNIFNLRFIKNFDGKCPKCGSTDIYQRADDNEESAKNRINVYHSQTEPVVGFYKNKTYYKEVDGSKNKEEVFEEISKFINRKK
ncbi:Adenylate kinase [Elusimicrobium minutum Pei191]|uniref:Adenylate kinase n=1 Tax=Elusimicrobium minutum (strain Pei191) TaxID=445932 RepID=KAD_ELUMP|nr:adenylate kinase [Elusimicrobium minutum]B2KEK1.1 RecName: Full=Adenylate kinase; Short=AK; AltName: Full=ATP-AMP transphosphorylase; AltName: Full=ATP:AMP phosphotransferase; AltName: Full=Adenylate monophosphate kinase [Elusimicrobium minutum Pei191]ACC98947.1 Adenylate kinase [Elusimicrobium minutum Pei191]